MGFEPMASSLPRKCSTAELRRPMSGRRDSNPQPTAWKAATLPIELLPQFCGEDRIRTCEGTSRWIYSPLPLTTQPPPLKQGLMRGKAMQFLFSSQ